jgi:hypothetical protein
MSTTTARRYDGAGYDDDHTSFGWVLFAGTLLLMLATLNGIEGIAAVSASTFFAPNATYIVSDLNTFGWVLIVVSVVQGLTGLAIWAQVKGVRWIGVGILSINAIVQLMFIPAYPFWSLALFTLDLIAIYGLVAHYRPSPR